VALASDGVPTLAGLTDYSNKFLQANAKQPEIGRMIVEALVATYTSCTPVQVATGEFICVRPARNRLVYGDWWTSLNLCECFTPPLQGGGRWFEPSIAHLEITWKLGYFERAERRPGYAPLPSCCNRAAT
jgi:hypothetical protein